MAAKKSSETHGIVKGLQKLKVRVGDVTQDKNNPRLHNSRSIDEIAKSLSKYGQRKPIVVNKKTGVIEAGNGTHEAAIRLGWTHVAAIRLGWTHVAAVFVVDSKKSEAGYKIADNRTAELSEWNIQGLDRLIREELAGDLSFTGFELGELEDLKPKTDGSDDATEVEFTPELLLEHNYVVMYFDNQLDWQVAVEKFGLKQVKDLIPRKAQPTGIGRVIRGKEWLDRIR